MGHLRAYRAGTYRFPGTNSMFANRQKWAVSNRLCFGLSFGAVHDPGGFRDAFSCPFALVFSGCSLALWHFKASRGAHNGLQKSRVCSETVSTKSAWPMISSWRGRVPNCGPRHSRRSRRLFQASITMVSICILPAWTFSLSAASALANGQQAVRLAGGAAPNHKSPKPGFALPFCVMTCLRPSSGRIGLS